MKKIFLIFGLLILNSCATLESPVSTGMSKQNYCMAKNLGAIAAICNSRYYYYENGMEVLKKGNTYAVFKNVTQPTTSNFFENNFGNGTFVFRTSSSDSCARCLVLLHSSCFTQVTNSLFVYSFIT